MKKIVYLGGLVLTAVGIVMLATDRLAFGPEISETFVASRTILFPLGIAAVLFGGIAALTGTIVKVVSHQR